ncbi:MAG: hypothetical protein IJW45_06755 [Oscillospiraceae bacterium]|nr:hypothetical protein [Oscillospiraceae bacterium]
MKRILCVMLTVLLLIGAAGCGAGQEQPTVATQETVRAPGTQPPTDPTVAPVTQPTQRETEPEEDPHFLTVELTYRYTMASLAKELEGRSQELAAMDWYTVRVDGLCTPVVLELEQLELISVSAYGSTVELHRTWDQWSEDLTLSDGSGAVVIDDSGEETSSAWIITRQNVYAFSREDGIRTQLRGEEDGIWYLRCIDAYQTTLQTDPLAPVTQFSSRTDFVYEEGRVALRDGEAVLEARDLYTLEDLYDLDQIFRDAKAQGLYGNYETLDQRFGQRTERRYAVDGSLDEVREYDADGRLFWTMATFVEMDSRKYYGYMSTVVGPDGRDQESVYLRGGIAEEWGYADGVEQWCMLYHYDETGDLAYEEELTVCPDTQVTRWYHFYDDRGLLVASCTSTQGLVYGATYDHMGRLLSEHEDFGPVSEGSTFEYHEDGSYTRYHVGATWGSTVTQFDAQGRAVSSENYGDALLESTVTYHYDATGALVEEVWVDHMDPADSCRITYTYEYDSFGNWTRRTTFRDGQEETVEQRQFDRDGRLVDDGTFVYFYDAQGRVIQKKQELDGETIVHLYTYDEAGKLLKEVCY